MSQRQHQVISYLCGEASPSEKQATEVLLAFDPELAQWASLVRSCLDAMRTDRSVSAPHDVRELAKSIVSRAPVTPDWLATLSRVVATLVPRPATALPGFRGAEEVLRHEFDSSAGKVYFLLTPPASSETHWRVRGLMENAPELPIEALFLPLDADSPIAATAKFDPSASFHARVAPGVFRIVIRLNHQAVEIPMLRIG